MLLHNGPSGFRACEGSVASQVPEMSWTYPCVSDIPRSEGLRAHLLMGVGSALCSAGCVWRCIGYGKQVADRDLGCRVGIDEVRREGARYALP